MNNTLAVVVVGLVVLIAAIALYKAYSSSDNDNDSSGSENTVTTSKPWSSIYGSSVTPFAIPVNPASPAWKPFSPSHRHHGGSTPTRTYVIDPTQQPESSGYNMQSSQALGAYPADSAITCADMSAGFCMTDLNTAMRLCDANTACIGIVYDGSNSATKLATPITETPLSWNTNNTEYSGSVFLTPITGTTPPSGTFSLPPATATQVEMGGISGATGLMLSSAISACANPNSNSGTLSLSTCAGVAMQIGDPAQPSSQLVGDAATGFVPSTDGTVSDNYLLN